MKYLSHSFYEGYFQESQQWVFARGVGLPGIAWEKRTLHWQFDVRTDPAFLRHESAVRYDIGAGFAIPIFIE